MITSFSSSSSSSPRSSLSLQAVGLGCFPMVSMLNHGAEKDEKKVKESGGVHGAEKEEEEDIDGGSVFANCEHHFEFNPVGSSPNVDAAATTAPGSTKSASTKSASSVAAAAAPAARRPELVVLATRPISKGEECCYSYVPPDMPRREQRELLLSAYGFDIGPLP
jgi:hypothetical protein